MRGFVIFGFFVLLEIKGLFWRVGVRVGGGFLGLSVFRT